MLGGLHQLVLTERASWDDPAAALDEHRDFLRRFTTEQGIQTNEVRRSWVLLPAFLLLAREARVERLDLIELGPSAGFNLIWDRYRYRYRAGWWGRPGALLELGGDERRPVPGPLLAEQPVVHSRVGIDLNPVDVTSVEGALLLRSFVWADQRERLDVLDRAVAAVREAPPELVRGDYSELLPGLLAERKPGALTVVFSTASLGYLTDEQRARVVDALDAAAEVAPLGWIASTKPLDSELTAWGLDARVLPAERRIVAHADFHGTWLEWLLP